jgi:hypothetical protein
MVKYRDDLPDKIVVLEFGETRFGSPLAVHTVEYRDDGWQVDNEELVLVTANGTERLVLYRGGLRGTTECELGREGFLDRMFDTSSSGITPCSEGYLHYYGVWIADDEGMRLETGAERVFELVLRALR